MKRKVIQIGESTQLVSLPRKWAVERGIKKGDELDIEERGPSLIINAGPIAASESRSYEIDISNLGRMSKRVIGALYRSGYDQIVLRFSRSEDLHVVQELLRDGCIGFELVEQGKSHAVIRKVSDAMYQEFDSVFKRCVMFLLTMSKDTHEAVVSVNRDSLTSVVLMDKSINKFIDFCSRILNAGGHDKPVPLYHLLEVIEAIADEYKEICRLYLEPSFKVRNRKDILPILVSVNALLHQFYELGYTFSLDRLKLFYKARQDVDERIASLIKDAPTPDGRVLGRIANICNHLYGADVALMELKL